LEKERYIREKESNSCPLKINARDLLEVREILLKVM
jgi:hypothetical protein